VCLFFKPAFSRWHTTASGSRYAGLCAVGFERWQKALRGGYYMLYTHFLFS